MATTIVTKYGSDAPAHTDIVRGELAVDTENGRLYTENSSGAVVELGLNPEGNVNVTGSVTASDPIILTAGALAAAGNAGLSHRSADNKVYLQAGTGGFNILDDQQNTHVAIDSVGASTFYGSVTADGLVVEGNGTYLASLNNTAQDARIQLSREGTEFGQVSAGANLMNLVASGSSTDMRFLTNSLERMRIDASGNVGIGESSPSGLLHLKKASDTADIILESSGGSGKEYLIGSRTDGSLNIYDVTASTERMRIDASGNVGIGVTPAVTQTLTAQITNGLSLFGNNTTPYGFISNNHVWATGTGDKYLVSNYGASYYKQYSGVHTWATAPSGDAGNAITFTPRMTLDASGSLGIGTTSPKGKINSDVGNTSTVGAFSSSGLNITSTSGAANNIYQIGFGYASGATNAPASIYALTTSNAGFNNNAICFATRAVTTDTVPTERLRIDANGNVGIGVAPLAHYYKSLEIGNAGSQITGRTAADTYFMSGVYWGGASTQKYAVGSVPVGSYNITNGVHVWNNAPAGTVGNNATMTAAMLLDASGNLLVGDSGANGAGRIEAKAADATKPAIVARSGTASDEGNRVLLCSKFSTTNTTSQVFVQFAVNNNGTASGQINANGASQAAFGSWSDSRLKEKITDLPSQLENIKSLRPVEFDYIESEGGGHQLGFIAQEVEEIYPDLVGERPDGMKTLSSLGKWEARLVKAIQEQQATIEALTARIAALES